MIEEFKKYLQKEHKSHNTIKTYSQCIEQFIKWYSSNSNKESLEIDKKIINGYKNYLIFVEKEKAQTISVRLCALTVFNRFFTKKTAPKNYILRRKLAKS